MTILGHGAYPSFPSKLDCAVFARFFPECAHPRRSAKRLYLEIWRLTTGPAPCKARSTSPRRPANSRTLFLATRQGSRWRGPTISGRWYTHGPQFTAAGNGNCWSVAVCRIMSYIYVYIYTLPLRCHPSELNNGYWIDEAGNRRRTAKEPATTRNAGR